MSHNNHMTVGEMKKILANHDDDTVIAGVGHFGEALEVNVPTKTQTEKVYRRWDDNKPTMDVLVISCEESGPDPE